MIYKIRMNLNFVFLNKIICFFNVSIGIARHSFLIYIFLKITTLQIFQFESLKLIRQIIYKIKQA